MTRGERAKEREAARAYVLSDVALKAQESRRRAREWPGTFGDAYRREIARLWAVALRAVRNA